MDADKLFKALGYELTIEEEVNGLRYIYEKGTLDPKRIILSTYNNIKYIYADENGYDSVPITLEEWKAINKKCEELGWI